MDRSLTGVGRAVAAGVGRAVVAGVGTGAEMVEGVEVSAELAKELVKGAVGITQGFGTQSREIGTEVGKTAATGFKLGLATLQIPTQIATKFANYATKENELKEIQHKIDIKAKKLGKDEQAAYKAELESIEGSLTVQKQRAKAGLETLKVELATELNNTKMQKAKDILDNSIWVAEYEKTADNNCIDKLANRGSLGADAINKWCKKKTKCSNYTPDLSRQDKWRSWYDNCDSSTKELNRMLEDNNLKETAKEATKDIEKDKERSELLEAMLKKRTEPTGGTRKRNKKTKKRKTSQTRKRANKRKTKNRAKKRKRKTRKHSKK
jgi:hypothetical protein